MKNVNSATILKFKFKKIFKIKLKKINLSLIKRYSFFFHEFTISQICQPTSMTYHIQYLILFSMKKIKQW